MTPEPERPAWAIRLTDEAAADVRQAWDFLVETAGEVIADEWEEALWDRLRFLSRNPLAGAVADEAELFAPPLVRHLVHRRTRRGPAYRILYRPREESPDGPRVVVISVRHGARGPMTTEEARDRDAGADI